MANIAAGFTPATSRGNIQEIYDQCLYRPTETINDSKDEFTFEALNGGLTNANIARFDQRSSGLPGLIHEEKFKAGSFARGHFYGFNFPDRFHQHQFNVDKLELESPYTPEKYPERARAQKRYFAPSYSLGCSVFIPWKSIVYVTYQGFFAADGYRNPDTYAGTDYNRDEYIGEFYSNRLYIDGKYEPGTEVVAPASRGEIGTLPYEHRWRWHHKTKIVQLDKGYHDFSVMVYPSLCVEHKAGKQQIYCGSMSILSVKSGSEYAGKGSTVLEWYGHDIDEHEPSPPPKLS